MFDVLEVEAPVPGEGEDPTGSSHHDVRTVLLQSILVLFDRHAAEEYPIEMKNMIELDRGSSGNRKGKKENCKKASRNE